jgi:choline dehydrogenase-like flavoprotein
MVSDTSRGSVRERAGRPQVRYDLNADDTAAFKRGIELLTELYWAAGARAVYPPVAGIDELRDGDSRALRERELRPRDLTLMAFHPLGTARADARPQHGVVDADLKLHGVESLYLADASVVPSSLGVNPQITIMALATRLAFHLAGKAPPVGEPEPEAMAAPRIPTAHAAAA